MKVLYVASECAPFVKTGGLADVIGAVPKALGELGCAVRILLPLYPALQSYAADGTVVQHYDDLFGGPARIVALQAQGLDLLLLDAPHLFDRAGSIYLDETGRDWGDNYRRFGALCRVGADIALGRLKAWQPDLVHLHDWQSGLVPVYLAQHGGAVPPCVMTIHNIAFQGVFDARHRLELGIHDSEFTYGRCEYHGRIGYLKSGIAYAKKITTVSPTYARELLDAEFGMGLEGLLQHRQDDLVGIINGIDLDAWNPATDKALAKTYTIRSRRRKAANKATLERHFGLAAEPDGLLYCVVSRLTTQKGLDLLRDCLPALVQTGARLALLGSGEPWLEQAFREAAEEYPGRIGVQIGYDETLSHLMQGGSDAILVPSRFEPCGLTQLYGLRYGTLPVVAETGGLADTVTNADAEALRAKTATGVTFSPVTSNALREALVRTAALYAKPKVWDGMVRTAMQQPVGWDRSAPLYLSLYKDCLDN